MKNLIGQQGGKNSSLCSAIAKQAADRNCGICNGDELCAMFAGERRAFFMMQGKGRSIFPANYRFEAIPW